MRDLINTEKVAVFIDDVIVETEDKEGHDELVAEIVKRLEENNLYVKPEKYKWKVRKVDVKIEKNGLSCFYFLFLFLFPF